MFAAGALGGGFWFAICLLIGCVVFFAGLFYYLIVVVGPNSTRAKEIARAREAASQQAHIAKQELLENQEQLKTEYSKDYQQRKITIGTIKCSQCQWSGQWGTGMTYEQFFAGNLAESGIDVARQRVNNDNLSRDNRQYTCPVCNSSGWQRISADPIEFETSLPSDVSDIKPDVPPMDADDIASWLEEPTSDDSPNNRSDTE